MLEQEAELVVAKFQVPLLHQVKIGAHLGQRLGLHPLLFVEDSQSGHCFVILHWHMLHSHEGKTGRYIDIYIVNRARSRNSDPSSLPKERGT